MFLNFKFKTFTFKKKCKEYSITYLNVDVLYFNRNEYNDYEYNS